MVNAGPDQTITLPAPDVLNGSVGDDGLPAGSTVTSLWGKVSGPGSVTFANPSAPVTAATFSAPGLYVLRLSASDSELVGSDNVVITVNRENRAPLADEQSVTTDEDVPLSITLTGGDPDGDPLTFLLVDAPAYGALSGALPHVSYTPKPDYHGPDQFSFKVSDGELDSAAATVGITIRPVNDAPVADALLLRTPEDTPLEITLSGSDIEGNPLQFSLLSSPAHGTLIGTPPHLIYQPAPNYHGTDSFLFRVNDGELDSAPAAVSILVESVNDAPVVNAGPDQIISLPTNTVSLCGVVDDDNFFETNSLQTTWSVVNGPGTVTFADAHALETTATFGAPGIYTLRLWAWDWLVDEVDELVVAVNGRPSVSAGPDLLVTYPEGATLNGCATDVGLPTNATLTVGWSKVSGPGTVHFTAPDSTNTTATFSESGVCVMRLTASDSLVEESAEVRVTVNRAPIVEAGPDQTNNVLGATLLGTVTDDGLPEGAPLTVLWGKVSGPGEVTIAEPTNAASTVTFSQSGIYTLRLTASDSFATTTDDVVIALYGAPVVSAGEDLVVNFPMSAALNGVATDDGLPACGTLEIQWTQVSGPGTATFAGAHATNTTVSFNESGVYVLRLTASDSLLSASDEITVTANLAPVVNAGPDQDVTALEVLLQGSVTDDGLPAGSMLGLMWSKVSGPGVVTFSSQTAETTATFELAGTYVLRLTANDGAATSSDDVIVRINRIPIAHDQSVTTDEDTGLPIQLQATDPDGDELTYQIVTLPNHGTLSGEAPTLVYLPDTNYSGHDQFTFVVSDGYNASAPATVTICVTPVNDPPTYECGA